MDEKAMGQRLENLLQLRDLQPDSKNQGGQPNLWSILKNNIGKELWKITMPVNFNEPLSFLQRLAEYMENYEILIKASQEQNAVKRFELVAAFVISALSANWQRTGKPFNPILGETFELNRSDDCGYRLVCEQVSHHPPVSAFYCEGSCSSGGEQGSSATTSSSNASFRFYGSVRPKMKFKGQSLEILPKGLFTLEFPKLGAVYHWTNVACVIDNIIIGKLSIEQEGCMEIISHNEDLKCVLNLKTSSNQKMLKNHIEGFISDKNETNKFRFLFGVWSHFMSSCDLKTFQDTVQATILGAKNKKLGFGSGLGSFIKNSLDKVDREISNSINKTTTTNNNTNNSDKNCAKSSNYCGSTTTDQNVDNNICCTNAYDDDKSDGIQIIDAAGADQIADNSRLLVSINVLEAKVGAALAIVENRPEYFDLLWKVKPRHPKSSQFYNFTNFALTLNEMNVNYVNLLPPTDSRFRPDVRQMEYGDLDNSSYEKKRLEDKQRSERKKLPPVEHKPLWFSLEMRPHVDKEIWCFNDKYWQRNWNDCPHLF